MATHSHITKLDSMPDYQRATPITGSVYLGTSEVIYVPLANSFLVMTKNDDGIYVNRQGVRWDMFRRSMLVRYLSAVGMDPLQAELEAQDFLEVMAKRKRGRTAEEWIELWTDEGEDK